VLLPPTRFNSEAPFFAGLAPARTHPVLHLMGDAAAVRAVVFARLLRALCGQHQYAPL